MYTGIYNVFCVCELHICTCMCACTLKLQLQQLLLLAAVTSSCNVQLARARAASTRTRTYPFLLVLERQFDARQAVCARVAAVIDFDLFASVLVHHRQDFFSGATQIQQLNGVVLTVFAQPPVLALYEYKGRTL